MAQRNQIKQIIELGIAQANVNAVDLNSAVAALAQENARARVDAASVADLTDNSGGTPGVGLAAVVTPTVVAQDGVALLAPKTAFDTQIGNIQNAHQELIAKTNAFIAAIAPGSRTLGTIAAATAADGTIAAITALLTGSAAADQGVEDATGIAQIVQARNIGSTICAAINWVRVAQGLAPITDNSGGNGYYSNTAYGPNPNAAATGTAVPAGGLSLTEVSVENALGALRNNIATMAAALAEANAPAIGPFVVATHNPRTRWSFGDVTP
jgi:hypothetical protein